MSPQVNHRAIAQVLAGTASCDALGEAGMAYAECSTVLQWSHDQD